MYVIHSINLLIERLHMMSSNGNYCLINYSLKVPAFSILMVTFCHVP